MYLFFLLLLLFDPLKCWLYRPLLTVLYSWVMLTASASSSFASPYKHPIVTFDLCTFQVKRGSLLSQPKTMLQKLATISDGNPIGPRNTRGFLFQTLSPEKDSAPSKCPKQVGYMSRSHHRHIYLSIYVYGSHQQQNQSFSCPSVSPPLHWCFEIMCSKSFCPLRGAKALNVSPARQGLEVVILLNATRGSSLSLPFHLVNI